MSKKIYYAASFLICVILLTSAFLVNNAHQTVGTTILEIQEYLQWTIISNNMLAVGMIIFVIAIIVYIIDLAKEGKI